MFELSRSCARTCSLVAVVGVGFAARETDCFCVSARSQLGPAAATCGGGRRRRSLVALLCWLANLRPFCRARTHMRTRAHAHTSIVREPLRGARGARRASCACASLAPFATCERASARARRARSAILVELARAPQPITITSATHSSAASEVRASSDWSERVEERVRVVGVGQFCMVVMRPTRSTNPTSNSERARANEAKQSKPRATNSVR